MKNREMGWALAVLLANFVLFASHAWALGSGLPSGAMDEVVKCAYYDSKDQDPTAYATEQFCHVAHAKCVKSCSVSAFSCVAEGQRADGKKAREAGFSEISEADARSRAVAACISNGSEGCAVISCSEEKRDVAPN
jgi:hypothetical protein